MWGWWTHRSGSGKALIVIFTLLALPFVVVLVLAVVDPAAGSGTVATETAAPASRSIQSAPTFNAAPAAPVQHTHTVRYVVTVGASGSSSITYSNDQGGIEQVANVQGDWDKTYTMPDGAYAAVSAQNQHDSGSVQCTIYVDGQVWKQSNSSGAYVIAGCNGLIGQ